MSQQDLATLAGVAQSTIGNLEAGIRETARKLPQIAHALGVDALWLAEGIGPVPTDEDKKTPIEGLIKPTEISELVTLFGQCGDTGRKIILDAARGAAIADPLLSSSDNFKLRR